MKRYIELILITCCIEFSAQASEMFKQRCIDSGVPAKIAQTLSDLENIEAKHHPLISEKRQTQIIALLQSGTDSKDALSPYLDIAYKWDHGVSVTALCAFGVKKNS